MARVPSRTLIPAWLGVLLCGLQLPPVASGQTLAISTGDLEIIDELLVGTIAGEVEPGSGMLIPSVADEGAESIPAIVTRVGDETYLIARIAHQAAGTTSRWSWNPSSSSDGSADGGGGFRLGRPAPRADGTGMGHSIYAAHGLFATYCPHRPADRERSGATKPFVYPVLGPDGLEMTRAFPMKDVPGERTDHTHHRSLWFTHGDVNGIDFWREVGANIGTIETIHSAATVIPTAGLVRSRNAWIAPDGKTKVLEDDRTWVFFADEDARIIEFLVTLRATEGPVTFGDTEEGSFGIRIPTSMDVDSEPGGTILNAEGLRDADAWGKRSPWVDYVGPVNGQTRGIAILNHPDAFRFPTAWHVRNYGLFAANPFGFGDFGIDDAGPGAHAIAEGECLSLRYRVILHKGDTESARISERFTAYTEPIAIRVVDDE